MGLLDGVLGNVVGSMLSGSQGAQQNPLDSILGGLAGSHRRLADAQRVGLDVGAAGPPGMPPPGIRATGGRAYAKGGAVKRADGGDVSELSRWVGKVKLRDKMGGKPPWTALKTQRDPISAQDEMRGQMQRSQDISDAVPRRAKGGAVKSVGMHVGTKVSHDLGKNDTADIGRKRVVTFMAGGRVARKAGGRIEASNAVEPATKLPGGSGGGKARLAKERRGHRDYADTP